MKIVIDAMGGDNAPQEIVRGSIDAVKKLGVQLILVGDKPKIEECLQGFHDGIEIVHTTQVISCDDDPASAIRRMKDSSMVVGMQLVAEGKADAFVSAGSTGAIVSGATLLIKRIKGIRRVALGAFLPSEGKPTLLIDCGANADCTPEFLEQFAVMGSAYAEAVLDIQNPKIGLLNNGTEETKGNALAKESHQALKELPVHFVGNVEAKAVLDGVVDVLVTDGFTGNAFLKTTEGTAKHFSHILKNMLTKNIITKLCAIILSKGIKEMKQSFSSDEYGGAPVLGAAKVVIKAHGSSNAYAFYNAIRQAKKFAENHVIQAIEQNIKKNA